MLIKRFFEDIDFKIGEPVSTSACCVRRNVLDDICSTKFSYFLAHKGSVSSLSTVSTIGDSSLLEPVPAA